MPDTVSDYVLDNGLEALCADADAIFICSQDPLSFSDATVAYALGSNAFGAGNAFGSPVPGAPNGRRVTSNPVTAGSVTASGSAAKWAAVDSANARLLANGSLAAALPVTAGETFTLAPFNVRLPGQ